MPIDRAGGTEAPPDQDATRLANPVRACNRIGLKTTGLSIELANGAGNRGRFACSYPGVCAIHPAIEESAKGLRPERSLSVREVVRGTIGTDNAGQDRRRAAVADETEPDHGVSSLAQGSGSGTGCQRSMGPKWSTSHMTIDDLRHRPTMQTGHDEIGVAGSERKGEATKPLINSIGSVPIGRP